MKVCKPSIASFINILQPFCSLFLSCLVHFSALNLDFHIVSIFVSFLLALDNAYCASRLSNRACSCRTSPINLCSGSPSLSASASTSSRSVCEARRRGFYARRTRVERRIVRRRARFGRKRCLPQLRRPDRWTGRLLSSFLRSRWKREGRSFLWE